MTHNLKCLSLNVNGIRDYHKRKDVFNYLRDKNAQIIMLQETHLKTDEENIVRAMWGYDCILNGDSTNSNGVGIFFNTKFQYKIHKVIKDLEGKYIVLDIAKDILLLTYTGQVTAIRLHSLRTFWINLKT